MNVQQLMTGLARLQTWGDTATAVSGIQFDSRQVKKGQLFVAVKGTRTDGHQYIDTALDQGAIAIVAMSEPNAAQQAKVSCWIQVEDSSVALGVMAHSFYGQPSQQLTLVGVTGTNGKTTVATLLYQLYSQLGYKTGLLSTVENRIGKEVVEATHTTPDAIGINALLAQMAATGCSHVFMEVSSHAADQNRIAGLHFAGGIFTNMSHDHLDYHGTFKAYIDAKKKFFDTLPEGAFALVNADDKRGQVMLQNTAATASTYSLQRMADFRCKILENTPLGLHVELDGQELFARLIGHFNAYNLLAVYGTAVLLGTAKAEVARVLSGLPGPEGRASYVRSSDQQLTAVVDYAHTPDSVEKIAATLREMLPHGKKLITVLGCGGDRDSAKRPLMAKAACDNSHDVILTSDNPRSEDPEVIIDQMMTGVATQHQSRVLRITDRRAAIQTACRLAQPGDIILVAGKGHEKYQEIKGIKHPFDDVAVLREILH
ncbi:MAG: UDP-N-acetylmuramoyl-L-alanyl-D-glutamate--2,6-diaminopimelate ligase [Saprospiraceae bacterium]